MVGLLHCYIVEWLKVAVGGMLDGAGFRQCSD
jgi:hypothetical protein